ncbi:MAG: hypothetical protein WBA76_02355 [Phormidesmis sp.]
MTQDNLVEFKTPEIVITLKGVQFQDGVKVVTGELAIADDGRKKVA